MEETEIAVAVAAVSPAIYELVEEGSSVERVAGGFLFTEGPVWHPRTHHLLFSDIPADVRYRYTPDGAVTAVRSFAYRCNGMTYDADLNLIVCEHATSSVVRETPDGSREIIAQEFEGEELNSPNDVVVARDGSIYFTDPWYGRMPVFGHPRTRRLGWQGVFRIAPGGGPPQLLVDRDELEMPNGLCFSPDERLLYVDDTTRASIRVYDVNADGSLSNGRVFCSGIGTGVTGDGVVDGMKCDEQGNIWVTGPGGIWVIDRDGEHLGVVRLPEETANLTWGGEDWHTLYVAATTGLYAIRTLVGPHREPYMG